MSGTAPRPEAQFEPAKHPAPPDKDAPVRALCEAAGPLWTRGGKHFERARRIVAGKLGWRSADVLDWEVRSYLRMDRPAWADRAGLPLAEADLSPLSTKATTP